jgi:hypothetical protein
MHGQHVAQANNTPAFAPAQERASGKPIGRARVFVADIDREKFEEAIGGAFPAPLR